MICYPHVWTEKRRYECNQIVEIQPPHKKIELMQNFKFLGALERIYFVRYQDNKSTQSRHSLMAT